MLCVTANDWACRSRDPRGADVLMLDGKDGLSRSAGKHALTAKDAAQVVGIVRFAALSSLGGLIFRYRILLE